MWQSIPDFGSALLLAILVTSAYSFSLAAAAHRDRDRWLPAARQAAYGTVSLITVSVLILAYAFVTHDFRIRYVARYSDRSMSAPYLLSALWGGQDGSILWWLFLLGGYAAACLHWMKGRYLALQPVIIATLMTVVMFFTGLMLFAANPFSTSIGSARVDGDGLNPLLQNFYMITHPPCLYLGFVGCTIPYAFAMAALISGRLDSEWIVAVRKWMLFAWLFLSLGNALGMLWAYVELGWGGYWAWDPVENASLLPWLTSTAYVHSTMIQERRAMLKLWNLTLICLTFFLTIFGTFLTRSGAIVSVHAFAQSNTGAYFVGFMVLILALSIGLTVWRWPMLRGENYIESLASREAAFLANNWALLGATAFVLAATTIPILSKLILNEAVAFAPPFFNRWMSPIGLVIFLLMGLAPLLGWRKTTSRALATAFLAPLSVVIPFAILHLLLGNRLGAPPFVRGDRWMPGLSGSILQEIGSATPFITASLAVFNLVVIAQEFWRGVAARRKNTSETPLHALVALVSHSRRRYGGYLVHVGVTFMFLGFLGQAWGLSREASLQPNASSSVGGYLLHYLGPRVENDPTKAMMFADIAVTRASDSSPLGRLAPAKFFYRKNPDQPTTEVSVLHSWSDDLYLVLGSINEKTGVASFKIFVNPLVSLIWLGVAWLVVGAAISLWPEMPVNNWKPWARLHQTAGPIAALILALLASSLPTAFLGRTSRTIPDHRPPVDPNRPSHTATAPTYRGVP